MRLGFHEAHLLSHAQFVDQAHDSPNFRTSFQPTRAADHQEQGIRATQFGERTHRDIDALERLDPAHEQEHGTARQAERVAGTAGVAGGEEGMLHSGGHDLDAAPGVAVEATELRFLFAAADADGVRAVDDLCLGTIAPFRLRIAAFGLDPRQGVEGADEREFQLVLHAVSDEAAQPVVGMHHIGSGAVLQVIDDAISEGLHHLRQVFLREIERAGGHVHHTMTWLHLDDLGLLGTHRPGVGGAVHACLRKSGHEFAHVHVHATTVARARLGERRRVEREHSDPLHDG